MKHKFKFSIGQVVGYQRRKKSEEDEVDTRLYYGKIEECTIKNLLGDQRCDIVQERYVIRNGERKFTVTDDMVKEVYNVN